MNRIRILTMILICGTPAVFADPIPKDQSNLVKPIAHFRFDGNARNEVKGGETFELKNTEFKDNALYLNGQYEMTNPDDGYRTICKTPKIDFMNYTVALRFKAENFDDRMSNLITGGPSCRWFGMERSIHGNLVVTLNNGEFEAEIENAPIPKDEWTVIACSVDVPRLRAIVAVNGKKVASIDLPKDFEVNVLKFNSDDSDQKWTFTNYGNGNCFHGLVDELLIYGQSLTAGELEKIPLKP